MTTEPAVVVMQLNKETKGAVQYKETGIQNNPLYLVGTLYLRKAGMEHAFELGTREFPLKLKVTVEMLT